MRSRRPPRAPRRGRGSLGAAAWTGAAGPTSSASTRSCAPIGSASSPCAARRREERGPAHVTERDGAEIERPAVGRVRPAARMPVRHSVPIDAASSLPREHHDGTRPSRCSIDRPSGRVQCVSQVSKLLAQLGEIVMPEPGIHAHRGAQIGRCGRRELRQFRRPAIIGALRQSAIAEQADQTRLDRRRPSEIQELYRGAQVGTALQHDPALHFIEAGRPLHAEIAVRVSD